MHPRNINIADFTYHLPEEHIALHPLNERDSSRLLVYQEGIITENVYRNIGEYLPKDSLLIFNNTRVVEARILFRKPTGAQIEIFCLEPPAEYGSIGQAMTQTGTVRWKCLIGGASKWKPGQILRKTIRLTGTDPTEAQSGVTADKASDPVSSSSSNASTDGPEWLILEARYLGKEEDAFLIEFNWSDTGLSFAGLLHQAGLIPLPPYIRRAAGTEDSQRYQTVYAEHDGSVAAPTAGLHFTEGILSDLSARGMRRDFVTLHVGAGTFLPVKAAVLDQHIMHIEWIAVTKETILHLLAAKRAAQPVIPVGTTSARTIESLYWLGRKTWKNPAIDPERLVVEQWDAYEDSGVAHEVETDTIVALESLLAWMERQGQHSLITRTQLLITPGYRWRIGEGLVTNFHQPESTLLLLVASLIGEDWKKVYHYALEKGFRFLSYGDGSLLLPGINHAVYRNRGTSELSFH